MIGQERCGEIGDGGIKGIRKPAVNERKRALFRVHTRWGTFRVTKRIFFLTIGLAVFFTLLNVKVLDRVEANNCLAILTFATILWATEVSPVKPYVKWVAFTDRHLFAGNSSICYIYYGSFPSCFIAHNTILGWNG